MARVELPTWIERVSGKAGNVCFRTMKATGRIYMYPMKGQRDMMKYQGTKYKVQCTKEVSERAIAQRERFRATAEIVRMMRKAGSKKTQKELWKIVSQAL